MTGKESTVFNSLQPILITTFIFGLSSLTLKENLIVVNRKIKILPLFYLSYYIFTVVNIMFTYKSAQIVSVINVGLILEFLASLIAIFVIYLGNFFRNYQYGLVLSDLNKLDQLWVYFKNKIDYKKEIRYGNIYISLGFIILVGKLLHHYQNNWRKQNVSIHTAFAMSFPLVIVFLLMTQYGFSIQVIQNRFALINRELNDIYTNNKLIDGIATTADTKLKKIHIFMQIHDQLNDLGIRINTLFSPQILVCLLVMFIYIVFTFFYAYYDIFVNKNKFDGLNWILWSIMMLSNTALMIAICHYTTEESLLTATEVHKAIILENDKKVKEKLLLFSQQLQHRPLQFSALGLFKIDATLMFTIGGAVSTYLLIMFQYQEGIEQRCSNSSLI